MSFYFYGTSVTLYGAKRLNHGAYQVSVDSVVYPAVNGSVPDPGTFQTPLFSATDLANGYHTVRMANLESRYLDLDFVRCSSCFHSCWYIDQVYCRRLHCKFQLDKPMKLSSSRLCRTRTHRSSTSRNSSGVQLRPILDCSLEDQDSAYNSQYDKQ
jgi:hypothetical protein